MGGNNNGIDDPIGWNLQFEVTGLNTYNIVIDENKTVQEAIDKFKKKSSNYTSQKCVPIMEKVDFSYMVKKHVLQYHSSESLEFLTIFPIILLIFIAFYAIYNSFIKKNTKKINDDENGEELITIKE